MLLNARHGSSVAPSWDFPQAAGRKGLELRRDMETENVYLGIGSVTGITWLTWDLDASAPMEEAASSYGFSFPQILLARVRLQTHPEAVSSKGR